MKTKVAYLDVLRLTPLPFLLRSTICELSTILMIWGCTSLVHPQIIKIINNSETVGRRKHLWKQKLLISTFYVCFIHFLLRFTVSELLSILTTRECTSFVHPQIIKIVDNSETVDRSKKMSKLDVKHRDQHFFVFISFFSDQPFLSY